MLCWNCSCGNHWEETFPLKLWVMNFSFSWPQSPVFLLQWQVFVLLLPSCSCLLVPHGWNNIYKTNTKWKKKKNLSVFYSLCCAVWILPQSLRRHLWQWDHRVILPCVTWHKINSSQMESCVPALPVKLTTLTLLSQAMHSCTNDTSGNTAATSHHISVHVLLLNPRFTTLALNVYLRSSHPSAHF